MTKAIAVSGSLQKRLALILTSGAALLAIIFFLVIRTYASQIAQQGQDNILSASVTSILDVAILRDGAIDVDFPYAAFSMLNTPSDDRVFYAIYQDGRVISGYENLPRPSVNSSAAQFSTDTFSGTAVRIVTATRTLIGADQPVEITVSVAQTKDDFSVTLNQISRSAGLYGGGFFLLAALLSLWTSSTTVGQLGRLARSVTRRGPHDLSPIVKPVPVEMTPLVESLNTLMARFDQSLKKSEDFIAEAAHRVRTPLATVRSHTEAMLLRVEADEDRQALRTMMRAIDESSRAAQQLLDHAMIAFRAESLVPENLDLIELLDELTHAFEPLADLRDIEINLAAPKAIPFMGDPILLENALRNLFDNALKYAPAESILTITCRADPPSVTFCDQGAGFMLDEITTLASRFVRGTSSVESVGSGLGLTIVKEVTEAHGGTMTLSNALEGGACVTLHF
jgi:two-component system sensor histidine kinase TctE